MFPSSSNLEGIRPESDLETRITDDPAWAEGAAWGTPRPGHPEGTVRAHIVEVLANVDDVALDPLDRQRLRLITLLHDTFKYRVDRTRPRAGENHHAMLARRFAERYVEDEEILEVIELHDEAYNAWARGHRHGRWDAAEARARRLVDRLGPSLGLYARFYRADNRTGSKDQAPLRWFEQLTRTTGDPRHD